MRVFYFPLLIFILVIFTYGCTSQNDEDEMPKTLRIGILPDENIETLLKRYSPLFEYLSEEIGVSYELKIPSNYEDLVKNFENGEIDLAYFGGFTYAKAHISTNAIPLIMRDIDIRFTSYFLSKGTLKSNDITDFKDKTFSFGSILSTSGHLMPRYFLQEKNIIPETFFAKVQYSGSHDKTAYWVRDGIVEIGVSNSRIIDNMIQDGRLNQNDIHIIWETPPYPDYVWTIQSGLGVSAQTKIRNAFLSLSPSNKEHAKILNGLDSNGFLPASADDFIRLHEIGQKMGLLKEISDR